MMPSATADSIPLSRHDDLDDYDVGDLSDDPFRSPSPPSKKRKEPDQSGLGIDEEVSVQKRARIPNVKLDEDRLLGPAGIPKLRTRAQNLKIKGKGHEFSDAARLLSFYQLWLDDLFPKAKFLDALAMVEKAGHKKKLMTKRNEWINEAKPLSAGDREDNDDDANDVSGPGATIPAPPAAPTNTTTTQTERPKTPEAQAGDIPDDDDLYDATPRITGRTVPVVANNDEPDADDLDALMAEAESQDTTIQPAPKAAAPSEAVEDDLDGLIAEAETHDDGAQKSFNQGNGKQTEPSNHDFADDEAAMQEMDGLW